MKTMSFSRATVLFVATLLTACGGGGGSSKPADPEVSIADASVVEGNSGTTDLVFTVSLSRAASDAVDVDYATSNGTATAGEDYTAANGTLTFAAGETSKTITVTVNGDEDIEANETLILTLSNVSANATLGTAAATGTITNDDLPTLGVADALVIEGDSGTTDLVFTVSLSEAANGNVNVEYATSDGTATAGEDYTAANGTLTINAGETTGTITVSVNGDEGFEANETLDLTLSNVTANAALGTAVATGTIANDDPGGLNDTGITTCGDYAYGGSGSHQNDLDCDAVNATATQAGTDADGDPVPAGQDAHFGRDADPSTNDDSDGRAGFSFTKLDANGDPLPADATTWFCVLDNVTGLIWEVKTDDDGLHDKDWTYTWYNSDSTSNGGRVGVGAGGSCGGTVTAGCDTEKFVAAVNNEAGLCGATDWRMPSREELQSIAHLGRAAPAIDTDYFPNTQSARYWSSSPYASNSLYAWFVYFNSGNDYWASKGFGYHVRLVRAGQ